MSPIGGQLQWAMLGLVTGAEVYGALPPAAAGRLDEFMNSELGGVLHVNRAMTEDMNGGAEVPELLALVRHVTYVQPWAAADGHPLPTGFRLPRGNREVELSLMLRTRVAISGIAYLPADLDVAALIARSTELFMGFGRATLTTPGGQSRPCPGILINKDHILFARRLP